MEVMLTSKQSWVSCYGSFGLAQAAPPSDLWHGDRNCHQTVCSLLLQGVILAEGKQSPRCTTSCAAAESVRSHVSIDVASMLKYWWANMIILSILCLSWLCARSCFGILPAPDHFSYHSAGTSDEERRLLEANSLDLICGQNLLTTLSCDW